MKDIVRQIFVALTILATIVVNVLANALPINGQNTGAISDRFQVYFVPAGYVFSIWGVIYIGLIALATFQALPSQRENPRMRSTGWWITLGGLANIAWIFLWHYEQFPLTLIAMLVLLGTLIITYLRLGIGRSTVSKAETWTVRVPISIYLGWITVATVANVTSLLYYLNWDGFGIAAEVWMWLDPGSGFRNCHADEFYPPRHCLYRGHPVGIGWYCSKARGCSRGCHSYLDHIRVGGSDIGLGVFSANPNIIKADRSARGGLICRDQENELVCSLWPGD